MKKRRIVWLVVLVLVGTAVIAGIKYCKPSPPHDARWRGAQTEAISEAIFRAELQSKDNARTSAFFLSIKGKDPSAALMQRFREHQPPVRKRSEAGGNRDLVIDPASNRPGMLLEVQEIVWKNGEAVEVDGMAYVASLSARGFHYWVQWSPRRGWQVVEGGHTWRS
jgi:hypothetical protein